MTRYRCALAALVFATIPACAGKPPEAGEIIDKAIEAHGGEANLRKVQMTTVAFKGTVYSPTETVPASGAITFAGADRQRSDTSVEIAGQKTRVVIVLAGGAGWSKVDGERAKALSQEDLAEVTESAHASWVATLAPLKQPQFTLTPLGESDVEGRKAWGVKVSGAGRRDVSLYFDQETWLLVKSETQVRDDSGQMVAEEAYPGGYKKVQGVMQPTRFDVRRAGKRYMEGEATEVKLAEKLDPSVFAKP